MRLYIAASSHPGERARVDNAFAAVRDLYTIVGDWRADVDKYGANPSGEVNPAPFAREDLAAVAGCDALWFLMPERETRGAWVELGAALALRRTVVISGPMQSKSIFTSLGLQIATDDAAVDYLRTLAVAMRLEANP